MASVIVSLPNGWRSKRALRDSSSGPSRNTWFLESLRQSVESTWWCKPSAECWVGRIEEPICARGFIQVSVFGRALDIRYYVDGVSMFFNSFGKYSPFPVALIPVKSRRQSPNILGQSSKKSRYVSGTSRVIRDRDSLMGPVRNTCFEILLVAGRCRWICLALSHQRSAKSYFQASYELETIQLFAKINDHDDKQKKIGIFTTSLR